MRGWSLSLGFLLAAVAGSPAATAQDPPRSAADRQYKRVHQQFLRRLLRGEDRGAVIADLRARVRERPDDAETHYLLAVAHHRDGDDEGVVGAARHALAAGLPAGRLFVEPFVGAGLPALAELSRRPLARLVHGPLVGGVTPHSARIWVRTAEPADVEVSVERRGDRPLERRARARTTVDRDRTAVLDVDGLEPDAAYRVGVRIDGEVIELGYDAGFETPVPDGRPTRFVLAFGGGAGFVPQHERMWTTIAGARPDLLLLLGDNVYIDDPTSGQMQRYTYHRRQSRPEFRALVARTPTYAIWDDHDFGTNDCFGGPEVERPAWKRAVWDVFCQNWANPGYGGGAESPGCWFRFVRGDVEFFMLDGRYYRTSPKAERRSMLGPVQRAWLLDGLAASRATFKVLCSPVPWDYRTKGDSKDTWNGYREERDEIFSFLARERIDGVVLLSADRHRSDAWRIERPDGCDLYEFNSSRLTNQHVHPTMPQALFSYNDKQSFGLVTFDTTVDDPSVRYHVVDIDGTTQHELTLHLSQLR